MIAASIRKRAGKKSFFNALLNFFTTVLHPINLNCKLVAAKWIKTKILRLNDEFFAPVFEEQTIKIRQLEQELIEHTRLQLGLETIFQTIGDTTLLFYAYSLTRTKQAF